MIVHTPSLKSSSWAVCNQQSKIIGGTAKVPMRYASMKLLHKHLVAALAIVVSVGSASAQSSGSGGSSSGSGSAGSTSGTTGGATSPGSPALGSTPSGPVTPNRSNSEIFPPSRLAPRPGGTIPDPGASTSTTTPSNQSGTTQNGSGTNGSNAQDPATAGSGRVPSPATGGAGGLTKTGKNPALDTVADCMKIWDAGTHMSKADWARTCRRVQGRLDDLKGASERQ